MLELENLNLELKLSDGTEAVFDIVEVEMFLQETIFKFGSNERVVNAYEIVPPFQQWSEQQKNFKLTYSEAWQIMKLCRQRFDQGKKKLEGS